MGDCQTFTCDTCNFICKDIHILCLICLYPLSPVCPQGKSRAWVYVEVCEYMLYPTHAQLLIIHCRCNTVWQPAWSSRPVPESKCSLLNTASWWPIHCGSEQNSFIETSTKHLRDTHIKNMIYLLQILEHLHILHPVVKVLPGNPCIIAFCIKLAYNPCVCTQIYSMVIYSLTLQNVNLKVLNVWI